MPPREYRLAGTGGVTLQAYAWAPAVAPRATVVLVHGLAEHAGRYGTLVSRLLDAGYEVRAFDQRGHGRSGAARAYVERFEYLLADLDRVVAQAEADAPGRPLVMLGHSMGGAVAFAYAVRHQRRLRVLVLSAPLLGMDPDVPLLRVAVARLLSRIAPTLGALRLPATSISRDPAVVRAYETDPLVYRAAIPARTLVELVDATARFPAQAPDLKLPVLVLHGTADALVPLAHVAPVVERIAAADCRLLRYEGLYHEVFNEPERERVYADLLAWLAERT